MDPIHPLRAYREKQSPPLTQEQLAEQLGTSKASVSRWETGERKPEPEELLNIAAKTGIAPSALRPDLARIFQIKARRVAGRSRRAA